MRGDMWRYLVVYRYGGIYADLDTLCREPIDSWCSPAYDMIVCPEHDHHLCQWTFAASRGNPIVKSVVDVVLDRVKKGNYKIPHFVHYMTGPGAWTTGILRALDIPDGPDNRFITDFLQYNELPTVKEKKFFCYAGDKWRIFHHHAVRHLYGSQNWSDGNYVKWIEDAAFRQVAVT